MSVVISNAGYIDEGNCGVQFVSHVCNFQSYDTIRNVDSTRLKGHSIVSLKVRRSERAMKKFN
jgi:hypothetical protein